MKIQHITLKGSDVARDTVDILPETIEFFKEFQIKQGSKIIPVAKTKFHVKVTVTTEGAMFDIMKDGPIAYTNACSFSKNHPDTIFDLCKQLGATIAPTQIIKYPANNLFIYTFPVNPMVLNINENIIAGEIALYIYYSLYLAHHAKL